MMQEMLEKEGRTEWGKRKEKKTMGNGDKRGRDHGKKKSHCRKKKRESQRNGVGV